MSKIVAIIGITVYVSGNVIVCLGPWLHWWNVQSQNAFTIGGVVTTILWGSLVSYPAWHNRCAARDRARQAEALERMMHARIAESERLINRTYGEEKGINDR